jgi:hypothetical protein
MRGNTAAVNPYGSFSLTGLTSAFDLDVLTFDFVGQYGSGDADTGTLTVRLSLDGGAYNDVYSTTVTDPVGNDNADPFTTVTVDLSSYATATSSLAFEFLFDPLVDSSSYRVKLDNISYTSTVVPVPAAVWLFGSGLLGLVGIARRKKAA